MDRQAFYDGVTRFIATRAKLNAAEIDPKAHLIQSGIVDSKLLTELILYTEDVTGNVIDIDRFQLDSFSTIEKIYDHYVAAS